jgi:hypothetical protein
VPVKHLVGLITSSKKDGDEAAAEDFTTLTKAGKALASEVRDAHRAAETAESP